MVRSVGSLFPKKVRVVLPYVSMGNVTTSSRSPGGWGHFQTWAMNDVSDPDVSGAGHQPLAHDQWAAFYDNYYVMSVRARITYTLVDGGASLSGALICLHQSNVSTGVVFTDQTNNELSYERSRIRETKATVKLMSAPIGGGPEAISTLSDTFFQNSIMREFSRAQKTGIVGAAPEKKDVFIHSSIRFPNATGTTTVFVRVQLFYDVLFFNQLALNQS